MKHTVFYAIFLLCIIGFLPVADRAAAQGDCLDTFDSFAYFAPLRGRDAIPFTVPGGSWQMTAEIPEHPIEGYKTYGQFFELVLTREINGQQEIWLRGSLYEEDGSYVREIFAVYRATAQSWEFIPLNIGDTFITGPLHIDSAGQVWGEVYGVGKNFKKIRQMPLLSLFDEGSRRFEFAENGIEIPLIQPGGERTPLVWSIVLDEQDIFWTFVQRLGVYRYDPANQSSTHVVANVPTGYISAAELAPDGSIYLAVADETPRQPYGRLGSDFLFQFFPDSNTFVPVALPEGKLPFATGMIVDHAGRIWLGATAYRETDGSWHILHPDPEYFLNLIDGIIEGRSYSYLWDPPRPVLESSDGVIWFLKNLDTGRIADGMAWYDPETGQGCQFTTYPSNIVEDSNRTLWMLADGSLYAYDLETAPGSARLPSPIPYG